MTMSIFSKLGRPLSTTWGEVVDRIESVSFGLHLGILSMHMHFRAGRGAG
jgi:hypothetical protein